MLCALQLQCIRFRRLLTLIAGWSFNETFVAGDYFFWIPLLFPHVGGLVGAAIYYCLVEGIHHKRDLDRDQDLVLDLELSKGVRNDL